MIDVTFLDPVQEGIQRVEKRMLGQTDGLHPELAAALKQLLTAGGKRIRVAVTLLMGGLLHADSADLITLASAIELLHTATLVHDDLIDGALIRRGTPTLNASWSPAATVLTGDFIFARAAQMASEIDDVKIMVLFSETLATIVNGEINQMFGKHLLMDRVAYEKQIYAKTGSLFEVACKSAAMLSTKDENIRECARNYGYHIGMAFQVVDDILDFTGEQKTVGKPVASDLRQGLVTLPAILYVELGGNASLLKSVIQGQALEDEVMFLVKAIRSGGAIQAAMDVAQGYIEHGLQALADFPDTSEKRGLESLARYIVQRSK